MPSRDVLDRSVAGPDLVVRYDDHTEAVIDVFLPMPPATADADPRAAPRPSPVPGVDSLGLRSVELRRPPLVVFLHGGYWRAEWDRVHVRPLAWGLASSGFVVAAPEYRRGDRLWHAMSADVELCVQLASRLVSAEVDAVDPAAPVILAGHSAGGHLALWAGSRLGPEVVRRIVALAPVIDVRYAAAHGLGDDATQDLLGGEPDVVPDAYDEADVLRLTGRKVPVAVIQGDEDMQVPVAMNRSVAKGGSAFVMSAPFRYVELPGVDHFALIDPESDAWPTVLRAFHET